MEEVFRPSFGDRASDEAWVKSCDAARAKQLVEFAISPGCSVPTLRGLLTAGAEVTRAHFGDEPERLETLLQRGIVLRTNEQDRIAAACPPNARYRVAAGGSVSTLRGIRAAGAQVLPGDFPGGLASIEDLVRRGAVTDHGAGK